MFPELPSQGETSETVSDSYVSGRTCRLSLLAAGLVPVPGFGSRREGILGLGAASVSGCLISRNSSPCYFLGFSARFIDMPRSEAARCHGNSRQRGRRGEALPRVTVQAHVCMMSLEPPHLRCLSAALAHETFAFMASVVQDDGGRPLYVPAETSSKDTTMFHVPQRSWGNASPSSADTFCHRTAKRDK